MTNPDPREANLPKWAQHELALLRMRLRDAEKSRDDARLATDPAGSSAVLGEYDDIPIGLGAEARVAFKGKSLTASVLVNEWGEIELRGSESFDVRPQSSNVIQIVPRRPAA